eukprot:NODE_7308_length_776_cov_67.087289_g7067_i0.p1 GENE.NODE_7308_length_776_cov_67.087289_g7067_i0~~NODE_7308_length_776_cov_67.087289_g7067_i0.p1  ORF type:complete len:138 (+),score=9.55 NODE_7308_length_776_cov_67.087289_g7067_i0:132-545(+)
MGCVSSQPKKSASCSTLTQLAVTPAVKRLEDDVGTDRRPSSKSPKSPKSTVADDLQATSFISTVMSEIPDDVPWEIVERQHQSVSPSGLTCVKCAEPIDLHDLMKLEDGRSFHKGCFQHLLHLADPDSPATRHWLYA